VVFEVFGHVQKILLVKLKRSVHNFHVEKTFEKSTLEPLTLELDLKFRTNFDFFIPKFDAQKAEFFLIVFS
jgi:hypothetical protein